jgi:hypothetical protein
MGFLKNYRESSPLTPEEMANENSVANTTGYLLLIGGAILGGILYGDSHHWFDGLHQTTTDTSGIPPMHPSIDLDPHHLYGSENDALLAQFGGAPVSMIHNTSDLRIVVSHDNQFVSQTSISMQDFVKVLYAANSPAKDHAAQIFLEFYRRGVNPALGLADFKIESNYGTDPNSVGQITQNWSNMRTSWNNELNLPTYHAGNNGDFANFSNNGGWVQSAIESAKMFQAFGQEHYRSTDQFLSVFKIIDPSSDKNDPVALAASIKGKMMNYYHHKDANGNALASIVIPDQSISVVSAPVVPWSVLRSVGSVGRRVA